MWKNIYIKITISDMILEKKKWNISSSISLLFDINESLKWNLTSIDNFTNDLNLKRYLLCNTYNLALLKISLENFKWNSLQHNILILIILWWILSASLKLNIWQNLFCFQNHFFAKQKVNKKMKTKFVLFSYRHYNELTKKN